MKSKLFLLALLTLTISNTYAATSSVTSCGPIKSHFRDLEETIHPEILGNLYAKAMLKIATIIIEENYNTFEDGVASLIQNSIYKAPSSLKSRAKSFNYWRPSQRISNSEFSIIASLLEGVPGSTLSTEEIGALNLVYLANKNDPEFSFSKIIYHLILKRRNSVVVTTPQLKLLMENYSTSCLKKSFSRTQVVNTINKINMAIANNIDDVKIEEDRILLNNVLLMQVPFIRISKKTYEPSEIENSHVGQRLLSSTGGSFNSYRKSNAQIHSVSNLATIKHFHKFYGLSNFSVLSKKDKTLTIYDESARITSKLYVDISSMDDRMNTGGAGIYYGALKDGKTYYAKALSDNGMREIFQSKDDQEIRLNGPIYILPEETHIHKFRIKNKKLAFSSYQFYRTSRNFNYSIDTDTTFKLEIVSKYKSQFVKDYINTLEKEKRRLMQILKIDNDDYNILAGFAIGVLSPESDFGKNWKYLLKEFIPSAVSIAKGNGLDTSKNSRGPTQIKVIPEKVMDQYNLTKTNLSDPENAAVATIAISADFLQQLRNIGGNHKTINEENIQIFLYYLYQGKRMQIKEASATPEKNIAIQKIMNVVNELVFLEY